MRQKQLSESKQDLSVPVETIQQRIYVMRGQKVMFDADLAELYQVSMLSSVLSSDRAVQMNIMIVRAFGRGDRRYQAHARTPAVNAG